MPYTYPTPNDLLLEIFLCFGILIGTVEFLEPLGTLALGLVAEPLMVMIMF